jgi:hypothetical protein
MNNLRAVRAARNNAVWCDFVTKAHGGAACFSSAAWWNEKQSPPYYPNVVTLDPAASADTLISLIEALVASPVLKTFAVKDSFCTLELAGLDFRHLVEASWIWKAPTMPCGEGSPIRWLAVHSPNELAGWEAAWWRNAAPDDSTRKPTLFPPALLAVPGVTFLAGYTGEGLVGGCVLVLSDDVVGLCCSFHETTDQQGAQAHLVSEIHRRHPSRSIVGYESGERLRAALRCGFEPVGALRVWLRNAAHRAPLGLPKPPPKEAITTRPACERQPRTRLAPVGACVACAAPTGDKPAPECIDRT